MQNFSFECIGETKTEDETHISQSLTEFGRLIASIEDERDRMVSNLKEKKQKIQKIMLKMQMKNNQKKKDLKLKKLMHINLEN